MVLCERNMQEKSLISLRMVAKLPKHVVEIFNLPEDGAKWPKHVGEIFNLTEDGR